MKRFIKLLSMFMAVMMILTGTTQVFAYSAENGTASKKFTDEKVMALNTLEEFTQNTLEINNYEEMNRIKNTTRNAINKGLVDIKAKDMVLDYDNAKYYDYSENSDGEYSIISIPIVGDKYSLLSSIGIIYHKSENNDGISNYDQIASYSETLITKSNDNKFIITVYQDGTILRNEKTDIGYINNIEIQNSLDIMKEYSNDMVTMGTGAVAACIAAVAGVTGAFGAMIVSLCGTACSAVITPPGAIVCAACVAAIAALGGSSITGVVKCFELL